MIRRYGFAAILLAIAFSSRASALDRIKLLQGTPSVIQGNITEMSSSVVKIEQGPVPKKIEVNQIDFIEFDEDPKELRNARNVTKAGKYADAIALVKKVKAADISRAEIKQDLDFYKALLLARVAMGGEGSLQDAGRLLLTFEKNNPNNYHYFEACELLGELLVADKKFDKAEPYYAKLASAPWPDYRVRAAVLTGRTLEAQKKYDKAIAKYEEAEGMEGDGKDVERQKLTATLGKATSLAGSGKTDDAIKLVQDVIAKSDPENVELNARAYNAMGDCFRKADKTKEALMAYLHVDTLYFSAPEQHAEALANLAELWKKVDKAERASEASDQLQKDYPNSRWAHK